MKPGQQALKHCPRCHTYLQPTQHVERAFCENCRFPLMLIAGKYRLSDVLGEGSTATIYLAKHIGLSEDNERVIKVVQPELLQDETARLRLQREIQVTIALCRRNEHIVHIYDDFGEVPDLGHYYVMEYLQGRALQDLMYAGEPLSNWMTFRIVFQLCKAIGAAHRAGIVHRDLKPENILLVERDMEPYFLKLIDFGIAKPLRRKLDLVVTQGALGTPAYMSPEQCLNQPVDGRSDVYAMGALIYELLTGQQPFAHLVPEEEQSRQHMLALLEAHVKQKPKPMREARSDLKIPQGLDEVILRTLEKDPNLRYQRVEDLWDALAPFAPPAYQGLSTSTQAVSPSVLLHDSSTDNLPRAEATRSDSHSIPSLGSGTQAAVSSNQAKSALQASPEVVQHTSKSLRESTDVSLSSMSALKERIERFNTTAHVQAPSTPKDAVQAKKSSTGPAIASPRKHRTSQAPFSHSYDPKSDDFISSSPAVPQDIGTLKPFSPQALRGSQPPMRNRALEGPAIARKLPQNMKELVSSEEFPVWQVIPTQKASLRPQKLKSSSVQGPNGTVIQDFSKMLDHEESIGTASPTPTSGLSRIHTEPSTSGNTEGSSEREATKNTVDQNVSTASEPSTTSNSSSNTSTTKTVPPYRGASWFKAPK